MEQTRSLTALLLVSVLAVISMGLWLLEIVVIKDWDSLRWLTERLYSPFIITPITVFSFIIPFILKEKITFKRSIMPFVILTLVAVVCFTLGKRLCFKIYEANYFDPMERYRILILSAIALFLFLALTCWFVSNSFMGDNPMRNVVFITVLLVFTVPLSLFSVEIIPGLGTGDDWVDAVKMGYPVLWITFLMGVSGIFISRQNLFVPKF